MAVEHRLCSSVELPLASTVWVTVTVLLLHGLAVEVRLLLMAALAVLPVLSVPQLLPEALAVMLPESKAVEDTVTLAVEETEGETAAEAVTP